jgi:hypothetical protein
LNVTAWKCERVAAIGKSRQFREKGHELPQSAFKADARKEAEAVFKHDAPPKQNKGQAEYQLRADFSSARGRDFDDGLPF